MTQSFFRRYVGTMVVLIAGYFLVPPQSLLHAPWQTAIGWLSAGFMLAAVRRNQLVPRIAWWLCALGIFANATGIGVEFVCNRFFGYTEADSPVPADAFWLTLYPSLVMGLSILAHRRAAGHDWATLVDAAIVTVGLSLLSWVFVVGAATQKAPLSLIGLFVVVAYPVGDLAVLGVLMRLLLQQNHARNFALLLISLGLTLFLCGDLAWTLIFRFNWTLVPLARTALESVFLMAFACFGAAAVHPDSRDVAKPAPERGTRVSPALLIVLATTSLIPSMLLLYQAGNGAVTNGVAIGVSSAGLFILVVFRVVGLLRKVESQARQLNQLSRIDELTGLCNRRAWTEELHAAVEGARRWKLPLCVALIDFDHFKSFNDTFGHPAGDRLLKGASAAWRGVIRSPDVLGRYGGEEFILILPNTPVKGGAVLLERFRPLMPSSQTFSSGLAPWDGVEEIDALLKRVDQALYRAKEQGRNRTVVSDAAPAADAATGPGAEPEASKVSTVP